MAESKFKNLDQHISFSEKIQCDILHNGKSVVKQVKEMDENTASHLLLIILNDTIRSIFNIVCDLQEIIIKSPEGEPSIAELSQLIDSLTQEGNELVREYNRNNDNNLKQKFETFLNNLLSKSDCLSNVIKKYDLGAHKHELVESLKEISCTLHRLRLRIKCQNLSVHQLTEVVENVRKQYLIDISHISKKNPEILKSVAIHLRHTFKHAFDLGCYLGKTASNYHGEVQQKILEAEGEFLAAVAAAQLTMSKINDHEESITNLQKCCDDLWKPLLKLLHFIENKLENKKASKNLKDVVTHVICYGMVNNDITGKSIMQDS